MILNKIPAENVYIACGYTDMRRAIDGLAATVQQVFKLDPFSRSLYLFCGKRSDRIKALYWEGDRDRKISAREARFCEAKIMRFHPVVQATGARAVPMAEA